MHLKHRSHAAKFACAIVALGAASAAVAQPSSAARQSKSDTAGNYGAATTLQHGGSNLHLPAKAENMELVGKVRLTDQVDGIADVAVHKQWAYVNAWDGACDGTTPATNRGGTHIVDISNPANPVKTGFVAAPPDAYHGEGAHAITINTPSFKGDVLAVNNESCSNATTRGAGGMDLIDVTDPRNPKVLVQDFGDNGPDNGALTGTEATNESHSVWLWQAGDKAYAVQVDNAELHDVDIFDISNPAAPKAVAEYDFVEYFAEQGIDIVDESALGNLILHHDMVVKEIGGRQILLASYWDAGYVKVDITDPTKPQYLGDTTFNGADPLTGVEPPEGNAHQAEFSFDNKYFIAADEDFGPYRAGDFRITTGPNAGEYPATGVSGGASAASLPDRTLNGPVVYGGYGCDKSTPIPDRDTFDLDLEPGEEAIIVLQRGPAFDPDEDYDADGNTSNDSDDACFPGDKAQNASEAGWDAMVLINRHQASGSAADDGPTCGSGGYDRVYVTVCTTHEAGHRMFNDPPSYSIPADDDQELAAIGQEGERVRASSVFDGWGYAHLYENNNGKIRAVDHWAIEESLDPRFSADFGDLSIHEWATDPTEYLAYSAYYAGGLRTVAFGATGIDEQGAFIDSGGSNFWGIEQFSTDGSGAGANERLLAGSDRDYGLYIVRYTGSDRPVAPSCEDRTYATAQNQPVTIDLVCRDRNGNPLTLSVAAQPKNGTLSAVSGNKVTYTPRTGFNGTDEFTYRASDGALVSAVAKITVLVGRCSNTIRGTAARDVLTGTSFGDAIFGGAENDVISGAAGEDCLYGEGGNDQLDGGAGKDSLTGQAGNDRLFGDSEDDSLRGGTGSDNLRGGSGDDRVRGDSGNDYLGGGSNNDVITGGDGRDSIRGESGNDRLYGGAGIDSIDAGKGANRIDAGSGNDKILAVNGRRDRINCGAGRDNVRADATDRVSRNCETVRRTRRTR